MGAKTWMLVVADGDVRDELKSVPSIDRDRTLDFVWELFPGEDFEPIGEGDLYYTNPPKKQVFAGVFNGVRIVAADEFALDYPSTITERFIPRRGTVTLHAMHSVVDWFAFARWKDGELIRSLSLSPDSGVLEDIGDRQAFEQPFWSGERPAVEDEEDEYAFVFHPLELAEAALLEYFGYQIEGFVEDNLIEPESFPLIHFERSRKSSWWQFWK